MRTLKVMMAYCGTRYHGYQRQNNANTVQAVVEAAVSKLLNTPTDCRMFPNRHRRTCGAVLFLAYHRKSHSLPEFCAGIEWIFAGGYFDFIL